jgi:hypothetical protein
MIKSTRYHLLLSLLGGMPSSCVYYTPTVPDMPYQGTAGRTTYPDTWVTMPPSGIQQTPVPGPVTSHALTPANPNTPLDLTRPIVPGTQNLPPVPAPAPKPTPAPQPKAKPAEATLTPIVTKATVPPQPTASAKPASTASTANQAVDLSQITNTGPIPVATRVPGDPTRVYNPLNPSKTIRVVDKDGKPYPSGKKLKVRGTNFMFYVP